MSTIYVDTGQIAQAASNVERLNGSLESKLEPVTEAVNRVRNTWDGAAADAVVSYYNGSLRPILDAQKLNIQNFVQFMKTCAAAGYEQTEEASTSLADAFN